ncbi:MAG: hypothetical protein U5K75_10420 [Ahrensia sp.]|nr:hypothetical protein [Ahrensia sp.]
MTAFSGAITAVSNVGPGLGDIIAQPVTSDHWPTAPNRCFIVSLRIRPGNFHDAGAAKPCILAQ